MSRVVEEILRWPVTSAFQPWILRCKLRCVELRNIFSWIVMLPRWYTCCSTLLSGKLISLNSHAGLILLVLWVFDLEHTSDHIILVELLNDYWGLCVSEWSDVTGFPWMSLVDLTRLVGPSCYNSCLVIFLMMSVTSQFWSATRSWCARTSPLTLPAWLITLGISTSRLVSVCPKLAIVSFLSSHVY